MKAPHADLDEYINAPCCPGAITAMAAELQRLPMRRNPPAWKRRLSNDKRSLIDYSKLTPFWPGRGRK